MARAEVAGEAEPADEAGAALTIEDTGLAGAELAEAGWLAEAEEVAAPEPGAAAGCPVEAEPPTAAIELTGSRPPVEAGWLAEPEPPAEPGPLDEASAEGPESPCELPDPAELTCEGAVELTLEAAEPAAAGTEPAGPEGVVPA